MKAKGSVGNKFYTNEMGHITKMTVIYGKSLKNLLLQNQWPDGLKTWCVALALKFYQDYSNDDLGLTLILFTARADIGKCLNIRFHGTF